MVLSFVFFIYVLNKNYVIYNEDGCTYDVVAVIDIAFVYHDVD